MPKKLPVMETLIVKILLRMIKQQILMKETGRTIFSDKVMAQVAGTTTSMVKN
jgi:hypothetical protein